MNGLEWLCQHHYTAVGPAFPRERYSLQFFELQPDVHGPLVRVVLKSVNAGQVSTLSVEAAALRDLGGRHAPTLVAADPTGRWLVMEDVRFDANGAEVRESWATLDGGGAFARFVHLATALARAHALGWVHRDVKPEHVFGPRFHEPGPVVLIDWEFAGRSSETASTTVEGTPEIMAGRYSPYPEWRSPGAPGTGRLAVQREAHDVIGAVRVASALSTASPPPAVVVGPPVPLGLTASPEQALLESHGAERFDNFQKLFAHYRLGQIDVGSAVRPTTSVVVAPAPASVGRAWAGLVVAAALSAAAVLGVHACTINVGERNGTTGDAPVINVGDGNVTSGGAAANSTGDGNVTSGGAALNTTGDGNVTSGGAAVNDGAVGERVGSGGASGDTVGGGAGQGREPAQGGAPATPPSQAEPAKAAASRTPSRGGQRTPPPTVAPTIVIIQQNQVVTPPAATPTSVAPGGPAIVPGVDGEPIHRAVNVEDASREAWKPGHEPWVGLPPYPQTQRQCTDSELAHLQKLHADLPRYCAIAGS